MTDEEHYPRYCALVEHIDQRYAGPHRALFSAARNYARSKAWQQVTTHGFGGEVTRRLPSGQQYQEMVPSGNLVTGTCP